MSDENDPLLPLRESKLKYEIRKLKAEAKRHEFEVVRAERELEAWNASSDEHRIYQFFGAVDSSNVTAAIDILGNWARRQPNSKLTIVFNSPGGSVIHGLALYDFMSQIKEDGHHITTTARGLAASMGGILLQGGHERLIGKNSHVLIHEISSIGMGKVSEMEDEMKFMKRLQDRVLDILAERSSLSKTQIKNRWARKDWWLGAEECVKLGFADKIG